ncbi:MAG: gamma-glutamylcyclotransferase [Thermoplasmata archaeon]|nr:MAG: gamma-glutamylcyclotransferase [Thermoplasmata archaeon]
MTEKHCNRLFGYGTLSDVNFFINVARIEPDSVNFGWIYAKLYNCGSFPMIVEDTDRKVYGRVYTIKSLNELLPKLDIYERCNIEPIEDSFYIRKIIPVILESNERVEAWTYIGNPESDLYKLKCIEENLIESGRWNS